MIRYLVLRHIAYDKLVDHLGVMVRGPEVDVLTTTDIPTPMYVKKVINFPFDLYFNVQSVHDDEWFRSLREYDNVRIFQPDFRVPLPTNIVEFTKKLMDHIPYVTIVDDNYTSQTFDRRGFDAYIAEFKPQTILPKRLSISISDKCNLKCTICYRKPESEYSIMRIADVKRLPKELFENASDVELSGYGEILMNRDLVKILDYISSFPNIKRIRFTTNAVLLGPVTIDYLLRYKKLTLIEISIDTLRPKLYGEIRKNANFEKVMANINHLAEVKPKHLNVYIKMVLTKKTVKDLVSMVKQTKRWGFERLVTLPMHISREINISQSTYFKRKRANKEYAKAILEAKLRGVSLTLPPPFDLTKTSDPDATVCRDPITHPCNDPFEAILIQANGDVHPCCFTTERYGNLFTQSLNDVWFGDKFESLRRTVNTNECPRYCKLCGMTENVDNIYFMVKKGEEFSEPDIVKKVKKYMKGRSK